MDIELENFKCKMYFKCFSVFEFGFELKVDF